MNVFAKAEKKIGRVIYSASFRRNWKLWSLAISAEVDLAGWESVKLQLDLGPFSVALYAIHVP